MGAFNILKISLSCPKCNNNIQARLQFKYGDTWQYEYEVGQFIKWGGNDIGNPGVKRVVVDAAGENCPECGFDIGDFEIFFENEKIIFAKPSSGSYDFSKYDESFIIIED